MRHIFSALAVLAVMSVFGGCVEHLEETVYLPTDYVSFKVSLNGNGNALPVKGVTDCMDFEEEEWILKDGSVPATKAKLSSYLTGSVGVYGYVYEEEWDADGCAPDIDRSIYSFDGDELKAETPTRWSEVDGEASDGSQFRVFAYAPYDALTPTFQTPGIPAAQDSPAVGPKGAPVIEISDVMAKDGDNYLYQTDIIVADTELQMSSDKNHRKEIPLDFEHIFTAVQFQAGFDCTITEISIDGVIIGGNYVIGTGWTEPVTGTISLTDSDIANTILMIPQQIPVDDPTTDEDNVTITVKYTDGTGSHTMSADLNGVEWKQGKKITYTLRNERKYIYLDLAAGNVFIEGNKYDGYVFVKGSPTKHRVMGIRGENQEYYIYQSCVTDVNKESSNYLVGWSSFDDTNHHGTGTLTLPSYPPVKHNGQLWSDYITNNTDVIGVIEAWDDKEGAGQATKNDIKYDSANGSDAKGAVRVAGREATKNRIHITKNIGTVRMIIDNIYSSYQQRYDSSQHNYTNGVVRGRTTGGISFLPDQNNGNSTLTIHIIGDNRLGCVNYQNYASRDRNSIVFEGSGSLTVGDTDYYWTDENSDGICENWGSNRACSVIGGKDSPSSEEDVYNIIFNSGVIYAGATTSSCTAIGGGGNADATVVINGGTITAVANTSGTAIGGGAGATDPGGKGYVTITNGNIYTYNLNESEVPSSAIGAAGSTESPGGEGVVTISGGHVYAYSGNGTAIGGGSSGKRYGGKGKITITGGTVIAKSRKNANSAGIGGGCSYTSGYAAKAGESKNGGDAEILISGNPVIRTGSIGGGTPGQGASNGRGGQIGSAQIYVEGGDIQAQFVMANSSNNIFDMSGGVIRNSSTSDNDYYCIQPNGGAVYMEKGKFTMKGGTVKDCSADKDDEAKGGAVYIKGDASTVFEMTGGTIESCKAASDGGAVYLEGGSVTISGGIIQGNIASDGNGGAISIMGGNFTLEGTGAFITHNAAFSTSDPATGSGGGIYVSPVKNSSSNINVKLLKGNITSNSSARNGGGICVDMGTNENAKLDVTVGNNSDGEATAAMNVSSNNAQGEGGGMYVSGAKANVILNDGYVKYNETSSYQVNPDISVDRGVVTLMKSGITTQATVTFSDNAQYYTQGNTADQTVEQHVVTASLCKLNANIFSLEGYTFAGWNTRRDGRGESYTNEQVTTLDEDITLYAQWEKHL